MSHVLFYTDTPNFGGAEKQMLMLARHLKDFNVQVSLAYGAYSKLKEHRAEFEEVCHRVYEIPALHKHDFRHYRELKKILTELQPQLLHVHLWNPGAGRYAFFAASKLGVPVVATEHDYFPLYGLKRVVRKLCKNRTAGTIAICERNAKQLVHEELIPAKEVYEVPNGIEVGPFLKPADFVRPQGQPFTITCIGELHERKGQRYLLEAFERLQQHHPKIELRLVGEGPMNDELRALYASNPHIVFLGWRTDIPALLHHSDLFVLPSLRESFGLVLLEAMAAGVMVISTNQGGPSEIIENEKTGLLVTPGSREALERAMKWAIANHEKKTQMEKAALQKVKRSYTAEAMAKKTAQVYEKVLKSVKKA
jgi:glycosyltransferase involved in cell wall biosynthesis